MRKRYKKKLRSCKLCKPHKMGIEQKENAKQALKTKLYEQEKREQVSQVQ